MLFRLYSRFRNIFEGTDGSQNLHLEFAVLTVDQGRSINGFFPEFEHLKHTLVCQSHHFAMLEGLIGDLGKFT